MQYAETLYSEKQKISRSNFHGEINGGSIILPCRQQKVITLYEVKSGKFFCYQKIDNFENYLACFVFTLIFFPLYLFNKATIISQTENHTELAYLLKTN